MKSAEVKVLKAHLAINVRNLDKSLEFYQKLFGIEPARSGADTPSSTLPTLR